MRLKDSLVRVALAAFDALFADLSRDSRPKLMLWGERDLILGLAVG